MASVQEIRQRLRSQRIEVLRSRIEPLASEAMTGHLHAWLRQAFSDLAMAVARAVVGFADQQHRGSGHERSCGNTKPGSNVASPSSRINSPPSRPHPSRRRISASACRPSRPICSARATQEESVMGQHLDSAALPPGALPCTPSMFSRPRPSSPG
jgi:hypothetical protein